MSVTKPAQAGASRPRPGTHPAPLPRPVFLNPLQVRLPVAATVSLAHRISGVLLVLAMPPLVLGLSISLRDEAGFAAVQAVLLGGPGRAALVLLVWCLAHHTAAGVRHLLFDAGIGTRYRTARRTAWLVHAVALVATGGAALAALWRPLLERGA